VLVSPDTKEAAGHNLVLTGSIKTRRNRLMQAVLGPGSSPGTTCIPSSCH